MTEPTQDQDLPVLPLKNDVLFPGALMPLAVGRPASLAAMESSLAKEAKEIVVIAQRTHSVEEPEGEELYDIGTRAIIKRMQPVQDGLVHLVVQGIERIQVVEMKQTEPFLLATVRGRPVTREESAEVEALHRSLLDLVQRALSASQAQGSLEITQFLQGVDDPLQVVYQIASVLTLDLEKEQALLSADSMPEALRLMHDYLSYEVQVLELRHSIASKAQTEMTKQQREYLLRQQLRAIQQELGDEDPEHVEIQLLRQRMDESALPEEVKAEIERQMGRLEKMPAASPDHSLTRAYVETVLDLPWQTSSEDRLDLARAREVLNEDHYDLEEIKERILEHLGVMKLNPGAKAPILCFVGPPGVGKTSLGQSIARALGRKFERMSLGGLHDEAELRGHRRTYIGAMPGRIIQAIRRAGTNNPVLMLDEVDKVGRDFRGDPSSALLEILDPEQNRDFRDNYLDLPFDLSRVLFISTANTLETIPAPLLDRMELLQLSGYSEEEKLSIAKRYLLPRRTAEAGLTPEQFSVSDSALKKVISGYTREAGVRQLERAIGRLARKVALQFAEGRTKGWVVEEKDLSELLGPEKIFREEALSDLPSGVAMGMAWTESGGDILFIEATLLPDGKGLTLTGQLGEVMRESAQAAQSYIWAHAGELGIDPKLFKDAGVHIHVPAGAIPKDGPSAGVTLAAALASLYTDMPVDPGVAMTGEITLTGRVLPVGGIKEKVLAARRAGIRRVILPARNQSDLRDLPEHVVQELEFVFVEKINEAVEACLPGILTAGK